MPGAARPSVLCHSPEAQSMIRKLLAAAVVVALGGFALAADLKSGPQAGEKVPGPFHPLNINGEDAGKNACLYCAAGDSPVVAVFARTGDDAMTHKLLKAIDAATVKNEKAEMCSFAVFSGNRAKLEGQLKDAAKKADLKKLILAVELTDDPIPEKYNLSAEADVTVILYKERVVAANYSFAKGKLTDKDIEKITADVAKIVK
jgi:D-aminopeptidase